MATENTWKNMHKDVLVVLLTGRQVGLANKDQITEQT